MNAALVDELEHSMLNMCQLSDQGFHATDSNNNCPVINMKNGGTVQSVQKNKKNKRIQREKWSLKKKSYMYG